MGSRLKVSVLTVGISVMLLSSLIPAQALTMGYTITFEQLSDETTDIDMGLVIDTEYSSHIPDGPNSLGVTIYGDNYNILEGGLNTNVPDDPWDAMNPPDYPDLNNINNYDLAVAFDSDTMLAVEDTDLLAPFSSDFGEGNNSPGNILIIQDDDDVETRCPDPDENDGVPPLICMDTDADDEGARPAGQFIFVFTKEVVLKQMEVFDIDADENDPVDIFFFDAGNNFIGSAQVLTVDQFGPSGDNKWRTVNLMQTGVKTMVIELAGSGAIDNIVYDLPIGGTTLPIDMTSLVLASVQTNSFSIFLTLASIGLAVFGITHLSKIRKQN